MIRLLVVGAFIAAPLADAPGLVFQLQPSGTSHSTLAAECSMDGGVTFLANGIIGEIRYDNGVIWMRARSQEFPKSYITVRPSQRATNYEILCPFGSSHARLRLIDATPGESRWCWAEVRDRAIKCKGEPAR